MGEVATKLAAAVTACDSIMEFGGVPLFELRERFRERAVIGGTGAAAASGGTSGGASSGDASDAGDEASEGASGGAATGAAGEVLGAKDGASSNLQMTESGSKAGVVAVKKSRFHVHRSGGGAWLDDQGEVRSRTCAQSPPVPQRAPDHTSYFALLFPHPTLPSSPPNTLHSPSSLTAVCPEPPYPWPR